MIDFGWQYDWICIHVYVYIYICVCVISITSQTSLLLQTRCGWGSWFKDVHGGFKYANCLPSVSGSRRVG